MRKILVAFVLVCLMSAAVYTLREVQKVNHEENIKQETKGTVSGQVLKESSSSFEKAPLFRGELLNGKKASLKSYMSKPVLLNMWTTTCGECQEDLAALKEIEAKFDSNKIQIVTVNLTLQEFSESDVRNFVQKSDLDFPIFLDKNGEIMKQYHIYGIPTSFLIDQYGEVIHEFRGGVDLSELEKWLPTGK